MDSKNSSKDVGLLAVESWRRLETTGPPNWTARDSREGLTQRVLPKAGNIEVANGLQPCLLCFFFFSHSF
jgi:hypothetical protein